MDRNKTKNKVIWTHNGKHQCHTAANHTRHLQLSSLSKLLNTSQSKKHIVLNLKIFWWKVRRMDHWQKNNKTMYKRAWVGIQMTALRFQTGGGVWEGGGTSDLPSPASLWGIWVRMQCKKYSLLNTSFFSLHDRFEVWYCTVSPQSDKK